MLLLAIVELCVRVQAVMVVFEVNATVKRLLPCKSKSGIWIGGALRLSHAGRNGRYDRRSFVQEECGQYDALIDSLTGGG